MVVAHVLVWVQRHHALLGVLIYLCECDHIADLLKQKGRTNLDEK